MGAGRPRKIVNDKEFIRDWVTYSLVKDMAKKYGVSHGTVINHARRLGLDPRLGPRKKI